MSVNLILYPNDNNLTIECGNIKIGDLIINNDLVTNETITTTQLYNAVIGNVSGVPNSLSGFDGVGDFSNVIVGTGLNLSGNVITAVGGGSGDVVGPSISITGTIPLFADTTGKLLSQSSTNATTNTLLGYNGTTLSNITSGTNIIINGGVISALGSGTGDVNGPGSSIAFTPVQFADTTGKLLSQTSITAIPDTLIGYSDAGAMTNITAGVNVTIVGGVISASGGSGGGNVTGPISSQNGGLVLFDGTSGELIKNPVFSPTNNSLIGYNTTTAVENIIIGGGLALASGVLSASGSGSGDVSGPISSINNTPAIYSGTTGKILTNTLVVPTPETLIGYNSTNEISNISAGNNIVIKNGSISSLISSPQVIHTQCTNVFLVPEYSNFQQIPITGIVYNVGSIVLSGNNLVVAKPGMYLFNIQFKLTYGASSGTSRDIYLDLRKNGGSSFGFWGTRGMTSQNLPPITSGVQEWTGFIRLSSGDSLGFFISTQAGLGLGSVSTNQVFMNLSFLG